MVRWSVFVGGMLVMGCVEVEAPDGETSTTVRDPESPSDPTDPVTAPEARDDTAAVDEGDRVTVDPTANDVAGTNAIDPGSLVVIDGPDFGSVSVAADGSAVYAHDGGEEIADTFTYAVSDDAGMISNVATVAVTIRPVNDAPVASDDLVVAVEGGSVVVVPLANDVDVDDALDVTTVTVVAEPMAGVTMVDPDGTITYAHDGSEGAVDRFSYTVDDASGATSAVATVEVTILATDDPPAASADEGSVDEGSSVVIDVATNDADPDSDIDLGSVTFVSMPTNGAVEALGDGTVRYTHDGSETVSDAFQYTVEDVGGNLSNAATVTVAVTPVNDPPTTAPDVFDVAEHELTVLAPLANDTDPDDAIDPTSLVVTALPAYGSIVVNADGTIDYLHDGSQELTDSLVYTVADASGATSSPATVQLDVQLVNDPPIASADQGSVDEGGSVNLDLLANDADSDDTLDVSSVVVVVAPANGVVVVNGDGTVDYTHDGSETVADSFGYTVRDAGGNTSDAATVTLTVAPVNDAPIAAADAFTVDEGASDVFGVLANDTDAEGALDVTSVVVVDPPTHGTAVADASGDVTYSHDGSESITDQFTYAVSDATGATSSVVGVTVTITPVNDAPVAVDDEGGVRMGRTVTIDLVANDTDADDAIDAASVQIVTNPGFGTVVVNADGTADYTHDASASAAGSTDQFTYTIEDASGGVSNAATVDVAVQSPEPSGIFAIRTSDDVFVRFDPVTTTLSDVGEIGVEFDFGDLAFDPVTGAIFMVDGRGAEGLYTIDGATGAADLVGIHGVTDLFAIEFDDAGTLWGITGDRLLYTLDPATGSASWTGVTVAVPSSYPAMAWDSQRGGMVVIDLQGSVWSLDLATGTTSDLGNPSPANTNNAGATYDAELDLFWAIGWSGTVNAFDPTANYAQTVVGTGFASHDGMVYVPASLVGSFAVDDGVNWTTNPPTYTCQEACGFLFGGAAEEYRCSTSSAVIDEQAYASILGVSGCHVVAQDYSVGTTYAVSGDLSTYVRDNCTTAPNTNYCFR